MARIQLVDAKISVPQQKDANGNLYPACILSNSLFMEKFEEGLIASKASLKPKTTESYTAESLLTALSNYRISDQSKPKDLPDEITEQFTLLPEKECNIDMLFKPLNNVPTEVMFFTLNEIKNITQMFESALDTATEEQREPINSMYESFGGFLNAWIESEKRTGSYFATKEIV